MKDREPQDTEDPLAGAELLEDPFDPDPHDEEERERFRRLFGDKIVPELLRRGLETGMDTFVRSDKGVRKAISDMKVRRELTNFMYHQIEGTRNAALGVIARETRDFLENTNLEQAIRSVLTSLAFEIRTEIRFVPVEGDGLRPKVSRTVGKARKTAGKKKTKRKKTAKRKTAAGKKSKKKTESAS